MLVDREAPHDIVLKTFENTGINITEDGKRHLGAVIGTIEYRENYVTQNVNNWLDELSMLCDIARIEPQAAYSCFVQCCSRGSRQHCTGKNPVQCCLNTLGTTLHK